MKVAWLAPYPIELLQPQVCLARQPTSFHACSWIINLAPALAKIPGIELHLVTESQFVDQTQAFELDGIHYHVVRSGIPFTNRGFPGWLPLEPWLNFWPNSFRLNRELDRIAPDVVHAHGTESGYARAGLDSCKPCLISIQGIIAEYQKTDPSSWFRAVEPCERRQVRSGTYFGCRTSFDSGFVRRLNPSAHIFELQEAMNPVFFENRWEPQEPPMLLFVGSVCDRKGVHLLIHILPKLISRRSGIRLCVVGPSTPTYLDQLKTKARELGVESHIDFIGPKSSTEIAQLHRRCRVYVLPTRNDNSPNTLAEAMVSGTPVIASRVGGISSMVEHNHTGLLCESGSPESLEKAIHQLLIDDELSKRLAQNARDAARERYRPDVVARQTFAAYQAILGK